MRTIIIPLFIIASVVLLIATLESCRSGTKSKGKQTVELKTVSPFTELFIEGVFPVQLSQNGDSESVRIEGDESAIDMISVNNDGNKLTVSMKGKSVTGKVRVYINIKKITELEFNSVGNLTTANQLKLDSLQLSAKAVGKIDLDITGKYLHADLNSVGATTLSGKFDEVRINNKSIGALSAFGLKANTLMIHNTAVGSTEVYADSAFYIRSSAVGAVYYKGPGTLKELKSEGIGRVQKKD